MVRVDLGQRNYSQLIFFSALCTDKECVSTHQQQPEGKRYVSFLTRILSMRCQSKYVSRVVSTHINIERSVKLYKTRKTSWRGTSKSLILILLRLNIHFDKLKNIHLKKKKKKKTTLAFQVILLKDQGRRDWQLFSVNAISVLVVCKYGAFIV